MENVENRETEGNHGIATMLNRGFLRSACEIMRVLELAATKEEIRELAEKIDGPPDFTFEAGGCEVRAIHENYIREVAQEEMEELIKECYLEGDDLPWWVDIDWKSTVQNCIDTDGYGHHFNSWDGGEEEAEGFYLFNQH